MDVQMVMLSYIMSASTVDLVINWSEISKTLIETAAESICHLVLFQTREILY